MQDFAAHSIGQIAPQTILYEGRYRIDLLLADAPTRAVYRAWDLAQHRPATILELATPDAATAAAALQQAAPLVQLNHAALTPIQVIFVEKGTFFLALTLAGGQTIERIMAERANPITPAAAVRWIAQAAEGVEFLDQELPTWHLGDLSPAALLITAEDRVQLLGFEVALGLLSPQVLTAALPSGTVAPELASGHCDARSDVYGLAATLYYLLTRQRWSAKRESLANARPDLSRALVATVMRGLDEQAAVRWPDAATFYQELLRSLPINHPAQRGSPWWDEDQPHFAGLAEEPPTLITTREQLRAAVAAQQAALGITPTEESPSTHEPSAPTTPIDTYIVMSPEKLHAEAPIATPSSPDENATQADEAAHTEPPQATPPAIAQQDDGADAVATADVSAQSDVTFIPLIAATATTEQDIVPLPHDTPDSEEQQDSTPPPPAVMADDSLMPEPATATIIRPRWSWSAMAEDAPTAVVPPSESSADMTEPAPAAINTLAMAMPTTMAVPLAEQATTTSANGNDATPQANLPEPAFADTLLRWPQLLAPEAAAANGTTVAEPDEQPTASEPASPANFFNRADGQPQEDRVDFADLTALPTQIKGQATALEADPVVGAEPAQPPAYSLWAAQSAAPAHNLPDTESFTTDDAITSRLVRDEDSVAADRNSPTSNVATTATSVHDAAEAERVFPTMTPAPTPSAPAAEQVIVAHSDYMSSEPPPVDPPKTSKTPSRPLGSGLLDKLRGILHTPGQLPALATGTVVVPRHMYPQHTYSVLVRLQCRPATTTMPGETAKKEATFIIVEVTASGDAFYVPVRRLALRLPNEGGLSEGTFTITALRPSAPSETDPIMFTFRSVDNQLLHEGQFLADISILSPQQLAGGNPMLTLVHALDIDLALA